MESELVARRGVKERPSCAMEAEVKTAGGRAGRGRKRWLVPSGAAGRTKTGRGETRKVFVLRTAVSWRGSDPEGWRTELELRPHSSSRSVTRITAVRSAAETYRVRRSLPRAVGPGTTTRRRESPKINRWL